MNQEVITRAKFASAAIAQARQGLNTFKLSELTNLLGTFKCPYAKLLSAQLVKVGIVVKKEKYYVFSSLEPVHFSKLFESLDYCVRLQSSYSKKYRETIMKKTAPVILQPEMSVECMIETLKAAGYKVFKPYTAYKPV